jgi:hypothetical protein
VPLPAKAVPLKGDGISGGATLLYIHTAMWCSVQECRGPNGERLKRSAWTPAVQGELAIFNARDNMVATLERPDLDRRHQVLFPLFDVRVLTLGDGLLVVGYRINAESSPVRECRQAWFCVPTLRS